MTWHHRLNLKIVINVGKQPSFQSKVILLQYPIDMKCDSTIQQDVFNNTIFQVVELVESEESGMVIKICNSMNLIILYEANNYFITSVIKR